MGAASILSLALASTAVAGLAATPPDMAAMKHDTVRYACDAKAAAFGLPAGTFKVRYYHGPDNAEFVGLSVNGRQVFLPTTMSADGAKYGDDTLVWWTKGNGAAVYAVETDRTDGRAGACHKVG